MSENNGYESEDKMILKIFFISLALIGTLFSSLLVYYYFNNKDKRIEKESIKEKLNEVLTTFEIEKIENITDGYVLCQTNTNKLLLNKTGKLIERFDKDSKVTLLYDGYYILNNESGITIKRENSSIANINKDTKLKLVKDKEANFHIVEYPTEEGVDYKYDINIIDENLAYLNLNKNSILYNYSTGKIILNIKGTMNRIYTNNTLNTDLIAIRCGEDNKTKIYNFKENKYILENIDGEIEINTNNTCSDVLSLTNSDYIVIRTNDKYGLIDYEGNKIIPPQYDEILFDSNNTTYAKVRIVNKYFLLDIKGKTILPFPYNGLKIFNNYIVTLKENELNIFDSKLNKINKTPYLTDNRIDYPIQFTASEFDRFLEVYINDLEIDITENEKLYYKNIAVTPSYEIIETIGNVNTIIKKEYDNKKYYITNKDNEIIIYNEKSLPIAKIENTIINDQEQLLINNDEIYIDNNTVYNIKNNKLMFEGEKAEEYIKIQKEFIKISKIDNYSYNYDGKYIKIYDKDDKKIKKIEGIGIIEIKDGYFIIKNKEETWKIYKII